MVVEVEAGTGAATTASEAGSVLGVSLMSLRPLALQTQAVAAVAVCAATAIQEAGGRQEARAA